MKYNIRTEHVRAHTLSDRAVICSNVQSGSAWKAKRGMWITYNEGEHVRAGRVLGRV